MRVYCPKGLQAYTDPYVACMSCLHERDDHIGVGSERVHHGCEPVVLYLLPRHECGGIWRCRGCRRLVGYCHGAVGDAGDPLNDHCDDCAMALGSYVAAAQRALERISVGVASLRECVDELARQILG